MKTSDYIVSFFESRQIEYIFGYQGGMITHLIDSISKNNNIRFIQCYHEQSAAIAAEGYARVSGKFGVAISTSGPGAVNMVTGIANAYFDSVPVVYITGQVNTYEYKYEKKIRQMGFQEVDIVSIVKPITKYAVMVDDPALVQYELEKSVCIALSGRKGPVLLDIPMNIQCAEMNHFGIPFRGDVCIKPKLNQATVQQVLSLLQKAQRPLVLCGGGIPSSNSAHKARQFLLKSKLPYVVSLMGKGSADESSKNFAGMIGSYGNRCANIIFANADVVLVLGSRLDLRQTGNKNMENLKKILFIHIDMDAEELRENALENKIRINADIVDFLSMWNDTVSYTFCENDWPRFIAEIKEKYSQKKETECYGKEKEPYLAIEKIMTSAGDDTIFTVDIGQNQMWSAQSLRLKPEQCFLTSGGLAPMGYALHAAVGAAFASPEKQIICIIGDGGFHMALQALLLISQYGLKINVCVLNNQALGMITQFQSLYFDSNMAGTTKTGGYEVPDIQRLAAAFRLNYYFFDDIAKQNLPCDGNGKIVEILLHGLTTVVPKLEYDQPLYNMLPYLNDKEIQRFSL